MDDTGGPAPPSKRRRSAVEWRILVASLLVLDACGLILAMVLAYQARFTWPIIPHSDSTTPEIQLRLIVVILVVWLALFAVHRLYDTRTLLGGAREYALVVNSSTYGVVAVIILAFLSREEVVVSRGWLVLVWIFSILIVGFLRFSVRRVAYKLRLRGLFITRAIVAGADEQGMNLAGHLSPAAETGVQIVGFVHDYLAPGSSLGHGLKVLGEPTNLDEVARRSEADLVIVVPGALSWESLQSVMQLAADGKATFKCRLLPGLYDVVASGVSLDERGPVPLLSLNRVRITGFDRVLKGILDYVGSVLLLVGTSPLLALLALLSIQRAGVPLEGRGYVGVRGKPFRALVFPGWHDEVLIGGNVLEKLLYTRRLYRLPGLLNVLRGEMSLVGPRRVDRDELSRQPKWRHSLLSVKPGLTGPWLLAGGERLTLDESLRLDLHYVRNYSIWLDIQILFKTMRLLKEGF